MPTEHNALIQQLKNYEEQSRERDDEISAAIKEVKHILTGNGHPEKGLIVRLDRIEQDAKRHNIISKAFIVAVVGAIVTAIIGLVKHLNP